MYLSTIADHVQRFTETVLPDGCGLFWQDNWACQKATMVQEWFEVHKNKFEVWTWLSNSPDPTPIKHLWNAMDKQV